MTRFADTENIEADNYWGNPPTSNIFNMVSLTILTADFFRFLCNRETGIDSLDHLDKLDVRLVEAGKQPNTLRVSGT